MNFLRSFLAVVLTAMAGGMGWGIRGQYGHETGAMIAGVLVGLTAVLLFIPEASSLRAARAVALTAIGISFGGSETYAQTIGLTHDPELIGNWPALRWGLFGLFIKGGVWIGFAGAFLGIGLSEKHYRPMEMAIVMMGLLILMCIGVQVLNQPFDPSHKVLPRLYFSHDWYWKADADFKPRREIWGGLLMALGGLMVYITWVRHDQLAGNLALVGFLAGGVGFPLGQCVQAFHAWNPAVFTKGSLGIIEPYMNWWNMMEISFGMIFGAILGAGLWLNRHRISPRAASHDSVVIPPLVDVSLVIVYIFPLIAAEFLGWTFSVFGAKTLTIASVPLIAILGGRFSPYLIALPIVAAPIAGKTLLEMCYRNAEFSLWLGWGVFLVLPLGLLLWRAIALAKQGQRGETSRGFAREGLLISTWLYFGLNFAFFRFPWPWAPWTGRTPSAIIFMVCALSLSASAIFLGRPKTSLTGPTS
jgi:hypothetical protein